MRPLGRRAAADPPAAEPPAPAGASAKGKITPRRTEARAARAAARKQAPAQNRKEAAARRRQALQEARAALQSTDVSKLPPRERAPELVYTRDLVDSRFHPAEVVIWVMLGVFLLGAVPVYGVQVLANLAGLTFLVASLAATWLRSAAVQRAVDQRYPNSTHRVRFYAARRLMAPRRFRRPVPRIRRGTAVS